MCPSRGGSASRVRSPVAVSAVSSSLLYSRLGRLSTVQLDLERCTYLSKHTISSQANAVNGGSDEVVEVKEFMIQGYRVEVSRYLLPTTP